MTIPACDNCFNIPITNIKIDVYLIINCNWGKHLQLLWCFWLLQKVQKSYNRVMKGDTRLNFDTDIISWTCAPYNLPFHSSLMWKHYILVTNQIGTLASFYIKLQIVLLGIVNGQMFLCPHKKEKCTGVDYFFPKTILQEKYFCCHVFPGVSLSFYWILKLNLTFSSQKLIGSCEYIFWLWHMTEISQHRKWKVVLQRYISIHSSLLRGG